MYVKLAFKNLKKSMRQYNIYFLTLIFGVALFYTFNSIETQTMMLKLDEYGHSAFKLVSQVMGIVSIFLSIVLAFLIIYANKYMIRYRSKEFSIYLTLGMSRRKLSTLLLVENIMLGSLSLMIGLFIGMIASSALAGLTSYIFDIPFLHFKLVFSLSGALKTIGLFLVVYMMTYIFNSVIVQRSSIIQLMKKNTKGEWQLKLPLWCYALLGVMSILLFYMANKSAWNLQPNNLSTQKITMTLMLGMLAVFLFFFSATKLLLFIIKKLPSIYFKKLNPYVFRQISSEMNTSFISLSITCIMIFLSLCMLVGSISFYDAIQRGLRLATPFEGTIYYYGSKNIQSALKDNGIELEDYVEDDDVLHLYSNKNIRYHQFLKSTASESLKDMYLFAEKQQLPILSLSEFNKNQSLNHQKQITLEDDQYLCIGNMTRYKNQLKLSRTIYINNHPLKSCGKYIEQSISNDNLPSRPLMIVIPDEMIKYCSPHPNEMIQMNIDFKDKESEMQLVKKIENKRFEGFIATRSQIKNENNGMSMMVSYLGLYIGIVFLMASTVVLSIQRLTKSDKDRKNYYLLREIGATYRQCMQSLRKQMYIFFGLPLVIALIESIFAVNFLNKMTELLGGSLSILNILISISIVLIVYIFYFVITYSSMKNNIK